MSGSPPGRRELRRRGWTAGWTSSAPAPTWTCSWAQTPAPAGPDAAGPAAPPGAAPAGFAGRVTLTVPLATLAGLADRPGELAGLGPVDPWLARDLAAAAAAQPEDHLVPDRHRRARATPSPTAAPGPNPRATGNAPGPARQAGGFSFTPASRDGPPGGYGTWRLRTPGPGPDLIITIDPITTDPCDHRHQASGHDPGVKLRHLSQVRHATCTSPVCRRPAAQCDHEHNTPYEAGGRTCLCNTGPKCRHDHRLKQHPKWKVDQLPDGTFRWTTPSGRSYDHRTHPLPDLDALSASCARWRETAFPGWSCTGGRGWIAARA